MKAFFACVLHLKKIHHCISLLVLKVYNISKKLLRTFIGRVLPVPVDAYNTKILIKLYRSLNRTFARSVARYLQ